MLAFLQKHTCTYLLLLQLTAVCVRVHVSVSFVCHWQLYCSRAAASCVSFSQGVCFLSCRIQSIVFFLGGGGGRISKPHLLSDIYTEFNFLDTHSHHRAIFLSKQTQHSSEKQTLFYVWARLKRTFEGLPHLSDCIWICCGKGKFVLCKAPWEKLWRSHGTKRNHMLPFPQTRPPASHLHHFPDRNVPKQQPLKSCRLKTKHHFAP